MANSILWFAFLKAMYRATLGRWIDGKITFKVTAKGLQRIADLPIRWGCAPTDGAPTFLLCELRLIPLGCDAVLAKVPT